MAGLSDNAVPWGELSRYTLRGRALVPSRTPDAVYWGAAVVDWALFEVILDITAHHAELFKHLAFDPESPLKSLLRVRQHIEIGDISEFPDASWHELLASYGLNQLGRAHVSLQRKRDIEASEAEIESGLISDLDGQFLSYLLEAVEAIHIAEHLAEVQSEAQTEAAQLYSAQQSEKAIRRHAATNELQDRFEAFYVQGGGGNKTQAAKDFLAALDPEDRAKFTDDDEHAIRTLTRGLLRRRREGSNGAESG